MAGSGKLENPSDVGSLLVVDDAAFDAHTPSGPHPENPERLQAARRGLESAVGQRLRRITAREATRSELDRAHDPVLLDALDALRGKRGQLDPDTYVSERSVEAAYRAAGGVVELVRAAQLGPSKRGLALVRPPGHHATRDESMGFCLVNHVAVAARDATARGATRVAIMDFDVHHGNGTQDIFYESKDVLYISTHQFPSFPGTGPLDEIGEGEGEGFNVNIPLFAGGSDGVYRLAFERLVIPVVEQFEPELLIVSAGFDAARADPLASMRVSPEAFGWMTRRMLRAVGESVPAVAVLEGGYDLGSVEVGVRGVARALAAIEDPETMAPSEPPGAIDVGRAAEVHGRYWTTG